MSVHYGPINKDDPPVDPEVWNKAKRLVQHYRPMLFKKPFIVRTHRFRRRVNPNLEDGWYYVNNELISIIEASHMLRHWNKNNPWILGAAEGISIDVYPISNEHPTGGYPRRFVHQFQSEPLLGHNRWITLSPDNFYLSSGNIVPLPPPYTTKRGDLEASLLTIYTVGESFEAVPERKRNHVKCYPKAYVTDTNPYYPTSQKFLPFLSTLMSQRFQGVRYIYVNVSTLFYKEILGT